MKTKAIDYAKLGLFVLAGVLFLLLMLYMIGKNRNLLGASFGLTAVVNNVNGLVPGNNVRFRGMNVGTVRSIELANDTAIYIHLYIDKRMQPFIKKNAVASIGTDGLMGNKLLNISPQPGPAALVEDGDFLYAHSPLETEEMLRTLQATNHTLHKIGENLYEVSHKLNTSAGLWTLLGDTMLANDLQEGVADFRRAGAHTADLSLTARNYVRQLDNKAGLAYKLFTDTAYAQQLAGSLLEIEQASKQASLTVEELKGVVGELKEGEGTAGMLLTDTLMRNSLIRSALHVEEGTDLFSQNMEALKHNFLFRSYFRKQEKKQKKEAERKEEILSREK
jgi:phospholipid/cholesterol/gamma-HCH transport system substrate-binding protein